jgi:hypothetical protein
MQMGRLAGWCSKQDILKTILRKPCAWALFVPMIQFVPTTLLVKAWNRVGFMAQPVMVARLWLNLRVKCETITLTVRWLCQYWASLTRHSFRLILDERDSKFAIPFA